MFIGSLRSSSAKVATITPRDIRKMDDARRVELGCSAVPGFSQHEFTLLPLAEAQTHDEIYFVECPSTVNGPMRLLNTTTFELHTFTADDLPSYAILSHCWRDGEVLFTDIQDLNVATTKPGWRKVERACWHAKYRYGFDWLWDDTCCIDKSSSAELSEALNSMFAWYQGSGLCLVYLDDVRDGEEPVWLASTFRKSRWFTRGWTLPELLAPSSSMVFLTRSWTPIGTRQSLAPILEELTKIDATVLATSDPRTMIYGTSLATRMSWAAGRKTSRPEDRAYSLMGIFNVSMPTIYGEGGSRAFRRLQLEIIRQSNDHSLFAWGSRTKQSESQALPEAAGAKNHSVSEMFTGSLLAASPDDFNEGTDTWATPLSALTETLGAPPIRESHFEETNAGIRIQLPLRRLSSESRNGPHLYYAGLACYMVSGLGWENRADWLGLVLLKVDKDTYVCLRSCVIGEAMGNDHAWRTERMVALPPAQPVTGLKGRLGRWLGWFETSEKWEVSTIYIRMGDS
ncbi:hypothetical protein BC628DRAFT_1502971 [Trametes gibbosa]|nr:hypothetical protein BC628DRAFT_1502971 [Trametes gibbosa]